MHLLESIGFEEKAANSFEATDPEFVRKVFDETTFIDTLKNAK